MLVDRLSVSDDSDEKSRLADSAETAFFEGHGSLVLTLYDADVPRRLEFSKRFESSRRQFVEPNDLMFNFNNPYGACPRCEGFGRVIGISEDLVVPDRNLSVYDDATATVKSLPHSHYAKLPVTIQYVSACQHSFCQKPASRGRTKLNKIRDKFAIFA